MITNNQDPTILIIGDEQANVLLLQRILEPEGYRSIVTVLDPRQAFTRFLETKPDLILLDLQTSDLNGFEVLTQMPLWIQPSEYLAVLVLTAGDTDQPMERSLSFGAYDILSKPVDRNEVLLRVRNLLRTRYLQMEVRSANENLEQNVRERTRELEDQQEEFIERLARAGEFRDDEASEHPRRVGELSGAIAAVLDLPDQEVDLIRRTAPLHDVGMIAIPDSLFLKPGCLTRDEMELMKSHTQAGAKILSGSLTPLLQTAEDIAFTHHERWDGSGYAGLKGEAIPIAGRIVSVADVFDALTHERPYRKAWPEKDAIEEIRSNSGSQFDPRVVKAFLEVVSSLSKPGCTLVDATFAGIRIQEEAQWRAQEVGVLNEIAAAMSGKLDLASKLVAIEEQMIEQLHVTGGAIYLAEDEPTVKAWSLVSDRGSEGRAGAWFLRGAWGWNAVDSCATAPIRGAHANVPLPVELADTLRAISAVDRPQHFSTRPDLPGACRECISIPLVYGSSAFGVLDLYNPPTSLTDPRREEFLGSLGHQIATALRNARLYEEVRAGHDQLRWLSQRLIDAQEAERGRIARELHDEIGQVLTSLDLSLQIISDKSGNETRERLTDAQLIIRDLLSRVRDLSLELRPSMLDDLGLLPALTWQIERFTQMTGISASFEHTGIDRRFPPAVETSAYRIVQEALTNGARHAVVTDMSVVVRCKGEFLELKVEDAGLGFDIYSPGAEVSSGLTGMRERTESVGGTLTVKSAPGWGTTITARMPADKAA